MFTLNSLLYNRKCSDSYASCQRRAADRQRPQLCRSISAARRTGTEQQTRRQTSLLSIVGTDRETDEYGARRLAAGKNICEVMTYVDAACDYADARVLAQHDDDGHESQVES